MPKSIEQFANTPHIKNRPESVLKPSYQSQLFTRAVDAVLSILLKEQVAAFARQSSKLVELSKQIRINLEDSFQAFNLTNYNSLLLQTHTDISKLIYENLSQLQNNQHIFYIIDYSAVSAIVTAAISNSLDKHIGKVKRMLAEHQIDDVLAYELLGDCTLQIVQHCTTWSDPEFTYEYLSPELVAQQEIPHLVLNTSKEATQLWTAICTLATSSKNNKKASSVLQNYIEQVVKEWIAVQEVTAQLGAIAVIAPTPTPPTLQAEQPVTEEPNEPIDAAPAPQPKKPQPKQKQARTKVWKTKSIAAETEPDPEHSSVEQMILAVCADWELDTTAPQVQDMIWEIKNQVNDQAKLQKLVIVGDISEMTQELIEKLMVNHIIWMVCYRIQRNLFSFCRGYAEEIKYAAFGVSVEKITHLKLQFKADSGVQPSTYASMETTFWPLFLEVFSEDLALGSKTIATRYTKLRGFIFQVFRRTVIDLERIEARQVEYETEISESDGKLAQLLLDEHYSSDHGLQSELLVENVTTQEVHARFYSLLLEAIDTLPHDQKQVFLLRFTLINNGQNGSYSDIEVQLGIAEGTVKSRLSRATATVVKYMQKALVEKTDDISNKPQFSDEEIQSLMSLFQVL